MTDIQELLDFFTVPCPFCGHDTEMDADGRHHCRVCEVDWRDIHELRADDVSREDDEGVPSQDRPVVFFYHPGETGDGEVSPVGWGRDQPRPGDIFLDTHADEVKVYYVHPYGMLGDEVVGHLSDMIIDAVRRVRKDAEAYQEEQE